jgi:GMP synthase (glutamine-hydrolysing)
MAQELGSRAYMFVWHNDEVRAGNLDMNILATTDDCPNHIWRFRDLPIWGIQGHPEITLDQSRIWFEQNRNRLEKDGAVIDDLNRSADETVTAKTMLTRFTDIVSGRSG